MKIKTLFKSALFCLAAIGTALPLSSQDFNKLFSVTSSIELKENGEKKLQEGEFTVPDEYRACNLKFSYLDVVSGKTSSSLSHWNIYDVNKKKILEGKGALTFIYPGRYILRIDGSGGACAALTYDLEPIPPPPPEKK